MAWFLCEAVEWLRLDCRVNLKSERLFRFGFAAGEFLLDNLPDIVGRELALESFVEDVDDPLADELASFGSAECPGPGADGQPGASDRFDDLVALQVAVGAGHCIGVDRQLPGQLADAGDHLARFEHAAGDRKLDLPRDLFVNREAIAGVDFEHGAGEHFGVSKGVVIRFRHASLGVATVAQTVGQLKRGLFVNSLY
jgi:hypothetical protein